MSVTGSTNPTPIPAGTEQACSTPQRVIYSDNAAIAVAGCEGAGASFSPGPKLAAQAAQLGVTPPSNSTTGATAAGPVGQDIQVEQAQFASLATGPLSPPGYYSAAALVKNPNQDLWMPSEPNR